MRRGPGGGEGPPPGRARAGPGSAAEEFRKLFDAVAGKVSEGFGNPLLAGQAVRTVQQLVDQAKAAVEPVVERNPQVFDHLAAAGNEILAAYRSAVEGHETRWTREETPRRSPRGRPARTARGPEPASTSTWIDQDEPPLGYGGP